MINEAANNTPQSDPILDLPAGMFRSGANPEEATLEVENIGKGGTLFEPVKFTEIDGWAIYEGDIILGQSGRYSQRPAGEKVWS